MSDEPEEEGDESDAPARRPVGDNPSAADAKGVERQRRKRVTAAERRATFWKRIFADPEGRAAMWDILQATGWHQTKFGIGPNGFPQPEQSWFHLGQKDIGDRLFRTWLKLCRDEVGLMLDEHHPDFKDLAKGR